MVGASKFSGTSQPRHHAAVSYFSRRSVGTRQRHGLEVKFASVEEWTEKLAVMEVLQGLSVTHLLWPAAAVSAVLVCAALVFAFGFRTPVEPAFEKSPLVLDDRKQKDKKRKTKDKKTSPTRASSEAKSESSKKSPAKEKKEEKVKEPSKPKEKPAEVRVKVEIKKSEGLKQGKKSKVAVDEQKPVDYDDGDWEEVPKKDKKKVVKTDDKKESPAKKGKKKKEVDEPKKEQTEPLHVKVEVPSTVDVEQVNQELREKINELQRVLKEAELRDNGLLPEEQTPPAPVEVIVEDKKKNKKDKKKIDGVVVENGKSAGKENIPESVQEDMSQAVVFDELGDNWSETKVPKKSKKKVRKE